LQDEYCPECGTHRVALFRYCKSCGLDYDELDDRGELPGGPYSPTIAKTAGRVPTQVLTPAVGHGVRARGRRVARYLPVGLVAVLAIAVVGALAVGAATVATTTAARETVPPSASSGAAAGVNVVAPPAAPTPEAVLAPTGATTKATVTQVVDGDTIIVSVAGVEYRVRYIGIDAPALVNVDRPVEFMGPEAADANRRLVSSATVVLERDTSDTDQYGQLLRNVWVDQDGHLVLVALELVRAGLARTGAVTDDVKYESILAKAQAEAQAAAVGIWGQPPLPMTGATTPAPAPTALPRYVGVVPVVVYGSSPSTLTGGAGVYTWRTVTFTDHAATVHWDLRASGLRGCALDWHLVPADGSGAGSSLDAARNDHVIGERVYPTAFRESVLVVTTTCPQWRLTLQGTSAP
jgi:micrococcal nuclease